MSTKLKGRKAEQPDESRLRQIKQTVVRAMFSDDDLFDQLVLKGGNAMDLIHQTYARASVDVDFSIERDLDIHSFRPRVEEVLQDRFAEIGYRAFDVGVSEKPRAGLPSDLAQFWGGYEISFKLIALQRADEVGERLDIMRREAILLGSGTKFTIDISRYEYTAAKQAYELDGMTIYAYPPAMIVCEKLRAICQQMPEYGAVIHREGAGHQRARDFIDIDALLSDERYRVELNDPSVQDMLKQVFEVKRVPLSLLRRIGDLDTRELHAKGAAQVRDTMKPGVKIKAFDDYFNAVVRACKPLEALWHV